MNDVFILERILKSLKNPQIQTNSKFCSKLNSSTSTGWKYSTANPDGKTIIHFVKNPKTKTRKKTHKRCENKFQTNISKICDFIIRRDFNLWERFKNRHYVIKFQIFWVKVRVFCEYSDVDKNVMLVTVGDHWWPLVTVLCKWLFSSWFFQCEKSVTNIDR